MAAEQNPALSDAQFDVRIVWRPSYMGPDDWHATVTRVSDGKQLVFIAAWRWLLRWKVRPAALERAFRGADAYDRKVAIVERRRA